MPLYDRASAWPRRPCDLPTVPRLTRVLLGDPEHFDVVEAINPHMRDAKGGLQRVDPVKARGEWYSLSALYAVCGIDVTVLHALPGHADFCFAANPSMVVPLPDGRRHWWLSRMAHPSRRGEVKAHAAFARARGIPTRRMPRPVVKFEGTGDGLFHPGRFLLHAGTGPRTDVKAWAALAKAYPKLDVLLYELVDERFYHLDTALAPLDETHALVVREALTRSGLALARAAFPKLFEVPMAEALRFAANAHCPDGRHVFLQRGCPRTEAWLTRQGFEPVPLETGEFVKSGGSVFCLKLSW
jgi:N-dimethylarginine dimethylaminohydrolase